MTRLGYGRYLIHLIRSASLGPNKGPFTPTANQHQNATPDPPGVLQPRR